MINKNIWLVPLVLCWGLISSGVSAQEAPVREYFELDSSCTVSILNRIVQADADGEFFLQNVPSFMGQVRARATCITDTGTVTGQTDYFDVVNNSTVDVGRFYLTGNSRIPVSLIIAGAPSATMLSLVELFTMLVSAEYADGVIEDVSSSSSGINYQSSNPSIATVSSEGIVTAHKAGTSLITARKDGVLSVLAINVVLSGDADLDGIPDDFELANGLDPANPFDADEDIDGDGLSALAEFNSGTSIFDADSDGDGIEDGEELSAGVDGFVTNPLLSDTDNDGLSDGIEVAVGSSPVDPNDANYEAAVVSIAVAPDNVVMNFNTINSETSTQLSVSATLIDGSLIDITSKSTGTTYVSADLAIVSFGADDGRLFAGTSGTANVTVSYLTHNIDVPVTVETFVPSAISQLTFTGSGLDTQIAGDYLYISASNNGLHVFDVSDRANPVQVGNSPTSGLAKHTTIVGEIAYVAVSNNGVDLIDISDPVNPALITNINTAGSAQNVVVDQQLLYVASSSGGLEIFDVRDSQNPFRVSFLDNLGTVSDIAVENGRAVVIGGNSIIVVDVSDPLSPLRLGSISVGNLRAVAMNGDYVYAAAYTSGFKVIDISNPLLPQEVSTGTGFYPTDVELTNGFAFFAEILFVNAVPFVNTDDPNNAFFQGVIDLRQFGDRDAVGLSLDASYTYSTGGNRLYIAQYRQISDNAGVAPTISISSQDWNYTEVVVEGDRVLVTADATDDVAVASVGFFIDDVLLYTDTTSPYQFPYNVPASVTSLKVYAVATDLGGNARQSNATELTVEPDADSDGLGDFEELLTWGTNVNNPDSDGDGLLDGVEVDLGTDPLNPDSDGDGLIDGDEVANETDPLNPDTTPPVVSSSTPADGALDIPENQNINIVFSEPLRGNSLRPTSFVVIPDGGASAVAGSLSLSNNRTQLIFTPSALMADNKLHTIQIQGLKDEAGNTILATEISFTTGNFIDTVRPSLVDISPTSNQKGVPLNSLISVILSEPVKPETVTDTTFYVTDLSTNQRFGGVRTVSDNKSSVLFTPNTPFLVGRQYRVTLTTGIRDLFDLAFIGTSRNFTTSFESDGIAPRFVKASVPDGAIDVPRNTILGVRFSEIVSSLSTGKVRLFDEFGDEVSAARSLSADRKTVVLNPVVDLESESTYQISIDGIEDLSGNLLPIPQFVSFTTGTGSDTARGGISFWSYAVNAVLPLNAILEVELNERIDPTTVNTIDGQANFALYSNTQARFFPGAGVLAADGRRLRFVPEEPLQAGHQYRLYVTYNTYLYDLAGNRINGTSRPFTMGAEDDVAAPSVVDTSILDGDTDVAVNSKLFFRVNEPLSDSCLSSINLTSGGAPVARSVALSADRLTVTVTPVANLTSSSLYELTLDGLCDYAGNGLTASLLSFTTSSSDVADTTRPTLVSVVPTNNSTGVSIDTTITMVFDETISRLSIPAVTAAGVVIPGTTIVSGNSFTFTPTASLPAGAQVRTYILAYDRASNSRGYNRYFTTESLVDNTAPVVQAISPQTNAIDVDPTTSVVLSFSEPMAPATINSTNIVFYANGGILSPSVFRSADGRQVTLSSNLPAQSVVTVVITDRVRDLNGNAIAPYASSFTTTVRNTDGGRPRISRILPRNGSTGWLELNKVVMYASEPMDPASVAAGFHVAVNGVLVDGEGILEVLGNGQTIQFTKDIPFAEGSLVQVYMSDQATDLSNNPLTNYSAFFRTGTSGDGIGVRPTPLRYSANNAGLPLNPVLQVLYSEPMDAASFLNGNVYLRHVNGGGNVPITLSLNTDPADPGFATVPGQILTVVPQELLIAGDTYYLYLTGDVADTDGDKQLSNRINYYYPQADAVVDNRSAVVLAVNPPDGESGVGVNPFYSVRYDEPINTMVFDSPSLVNLQFSENNQVIRYERAGSLAANTSVTETIPATNDLGGNPVMATSTTFTTTDGPDLANGVIRFNSVAHGATGVALNPVLIREFNEPIDPVSVTPAGIYLYDTTTGLRVPTTVNQSIDGKRLTMVPIDKLFPGRRYVWYAFSLRDLSGNAMANGNYNFTTGFEEDTSGPVLASTTVFDGQANIPINVRLSARFNEPLNLLAINGLQLLDDQGVAVVASISFSADRRTVTLVPTQLLTTNSSYKFVVSGLQDISNNVLLSPVEPVFTTGDGIDNLRGGISYWSYAANAVLPLNTILEVMLNERIDPTTINTIDGRASFALYSNTQNRFYSGKGVLAADRRRLRFVPDEPLQANHKYRLYVTYNTYLYDMAGNRVNGTSRPFTMGTGDDIAAPMVVNTSILDGDIDIAVNSKLFFRVNEPLSDSCLSSISLSRSGVPVARSIVLSADRLTVTVTPAAILAASSIYALTVDGLCDYAGNGLTTSLLSFTTSPSDVADTTRPTLVSVVPTNNSTGIPIDATISMVFNEAISKLSIPVVTAAGVTIPGATSITGDTVTFTPNASLPAGVQVRTYILAFDRTGNSRGYNRYFTTESLVDNTAPVVQAISPQSNAIDVDPITSVVLSFSEPMAPSTVNSTNIVFYANGGVFLPSVFRSADGRQVTLSSNLPVQSVVTVVITDRVRDLNGNAIAPYASSFTTTASNTDGSRPSISRVLPRNGSTGWLGLDQVVMYANEPLDPASVADGFHIAVNGVLVDSEGVLEILGNGQTIRFTKDVPFAEGSLVQIYLNDQAKDLSNNPLTNFSAFFRTGTSGDGVGVRPTPLRYSARYGLPLNPVLQVLYSEPMDAASFQNGNVYLRHVNTGVNVPIALSLNTDPADPGYATAAGRILTAIPQELLVAGDTYYLYLTGSVTDTDGDAQTSDRLGYFNPVAGAVVDDRAAVVLAVNPPDGESGVGVNPFYSVRYDEPINTMVFDSPTLLNLLFSEDNRVIRYERAGTLPANVSVTETLPATNDLAGNPVAATSATFTTTDGPDLANGSIRLISIAHAATNVALNPILIREYSEPIDPVSVTTAGVYLYDNTTGQREPTTVSQSIDGKRLTMVPISALSPNRRYYWYAFSLRDLSGNAISSGNNYFTTGSTEDSTGPVIKAMTVFDGQTSIPTNVRLKVQFDEPLNPLSVAEFQLLDDLGVAVAASISFSGDRRTVTLVPTQLLTANSSYKFVVAGLEDVSGNLIQVPVEPVFTTGSGIDNLRGGIAFWSYATNAVLPVNAVLEVELNERIDPTTINTINGQASFALYSNTQGRFFSGNGVLAPNGRRLRFELNEALQPGHSYRLYVTYNTYLYDLAGNRINGTNRTFSVSTATDSNPPVLTQTSVSAGQQNVPTNVRLRARFNEPLNPNAVQGFQLLDALDTAVNGSVSYSNDRRTATLVPANLLDSNSNYTFVISDVEDVAGNAFPTPVQVPFTSGSGTDSATGGIVSWSFASNAVVAVDALLEVVFTERADPTTIDTTNGQASFALYSNTQGRFFAGSGVLSSDGLRVRFERSEALQPGHSYRLYVTYNTYILDLAGNRINGTNRTFTVAP